MFSPALLWEDFWESRKVYPSGVKVYVSSRRLVVLGMVFLLVLAAWCYKNVFEVHRGVIRLHIIANSNSYFDQYMKYRVRDRIVSEMAPEFRRAGDAGEAKEVAEANLERMRQLARQEIRSMGWDYPVRVTLGEYYFPEKTYRSGDGSGGASLTLPEGRYEAVRVIIGEGRGDNWWCVLFPPLCFTQGVEVSPPEEEVELGAPVRKGAGGSSGAESALVSQRGDGDEAQVRIEYRFRVKEVLGGLVKRLHW